MADGKYLTVGTGGETTEEQGINSSSGAGDADKIPRLDAAGRLNNNMMPVGIGAPTKEIQASENLAAGDYVNIWDDSGTVKVRKADASATGAGKVAHGFVLSAVTSGNDATVYFEGENTQLTGLTGGTKYFLSGSAAGEVTATAPTTSGYALQEVGIAVSTTEINTEISKPIIRA
jgi:hypothetical protein